MQMDPDATTPKLPSGETYLSAHQRWFTDLYKEGIEWTRKTLVDFATFMLADQSGIRLEGLDEKTKHAIQLIAGAKTKAQWEAFCPENFQYPGYEP